MVREAIIVFLSAHCFFYAVCFFLPILINRPLNRALGRVAYDLVHVLKKCFNFSMVFKHPFRQDVSLRQHPMPNSLGYLNVVVSRCIRNAKPQGKYIKGQIDFFYRKEAGIRVLCRLKKPAGYRNFPEMNAFLRDTMNKNPSLTLRIFVALSPYWPYNCGSI